MPLIRPLKDAPASTASRAGERSTIDVIIAMSTELERMAWGIIIERQADMRLIAKVASCKEALALLKNHRHAITLVDESMLEERQCEALQHYAQKASSSCFILVTAHDPDQSLKQTRYAFADAYLLKGVSAAELLRAIRSTASGEAF